MKKTKKVLFLSSLIIILILIPLFIYSYNILNKVNTEKFTNDTDELGISNSKMNSNGENNKPSNNEITNIALFGIDNRSTNDKGRSDAILVVSINTIDNELKLISIMRDSYVNIDGYGYDKLNHAYAYGGPLLAVKTINQTFGLDIKDYVTVNFESVIDIIDYFGGITIDINEDEMELINKYQYEASAITGKPVQTLNSCGKINLTGMQALSYSRIRDLGNGDFERTSRQRKVCELLAEKIKNMEVTQIPSTISKIAPMFSTSLTKKEMINIGYSALNTVSNLDQERFPVDGYCDRKIVDDIWYLSFDETETANQIHKYIYEDIKPLEKDPLF